MRLTQYSSGSGTFHTQCPLLKSAAAVLLLLIFCGVFCGAAAADENVVITFAANNEIGQTAEQKVPSGVWTTLNPESSMCFTAPDNKKFIGWLVQDSSPAVYYTDQQAVQLIGSVTLSAQWAAVTPISSISGSYGIESPGYYQLTSGVTGTITVKSGVLAVLDLNGKTLDAKQGGSAVTNNGVLTLVDSGTGGKITGGSGTTVDAYVFGGGVYVNGGTFNMCGGNITGNTANYGGGVYVNGGTFTMSGGSITGNTETFNGGGVYVNGGTFTMNDGSITANTATHYGGGVYVNGGTFTMSGGNITNNNADYGDGGGVYVNGGTFTMSGGSITGNTAGVGGGVFVNSGTFNVRDAPVIKDNLKNGSPNNVYLPSSCFITVTGRLANGADIRISVKGEFAQGAGTPEGQNKYTVTNSDGRHFHPDSGDAARVAKVVSAVEEGAESKLEGWYKSDTVVTFKNGGDIPDITYSTGLVFTLPDAPQKDGDTFLGWKVENTEEYFCIYQKGAYQYLFPSKYYDTKKKWAYFESTLTLTLTAVWAGTGPSPEPVTYSVLTASEDTAMGTVTGAPTSPITSKTEVTLNAVPNNGFRFKKWVTIGFTPENPADTELTITMPAEDITAVALFEETPQTSETVIFLDANGGADGTNNVTAAKETTLSEITIPTKTGHTLNGFFTAKTGGVQLINTTGHWIAGVDGFTDASGNWTSDEKTLILYAQWTENQPHADHNITVTTDGKGSAAASADSAKTGDTISLAQAAGDGYQFKEWKIESPTAGLTIENNRFTMPDADVRIQAVFELIDKDIPIDSGTASVNSGTVPFSGGEGISVTVVSATNLDGDKKAHFTANNDNAPEVTLTEGYKDLKIYTVFTVTAAVQDGKTSELTIELPLKDSSIKDYLCLKSYTENTWTPILPKEVSKLSDGDTTYRYIFLVTAYNGAFAIVSEILEPVTTYTVIFNGNKPSEASGDVSGLPAALTSVHSGSTITEPSPAPTLTGYTFGRWYKEAACTNAWNFANDTVTADTTLYAKWTANQYTVTYDGNKPSEASGDVSGLPAALTSVHSGSTITKPSSAPTLTGYTFGDWYKEAACITPWHFETDIVTKDTTLYAKWTVNQYTITFDSAGGSAVSPITQDYGTPITAPTNPTKSGYIFAEWVPAVPETMPAEALTCTAHWTANQYTVTLDANGGEMGTASVTATYGAAMPPATMPKKTGCTFTGYFDAQTSGTKYYNADGSSAKNWDKASVTTLYAQWTANQYTVTYDGNGNTGGTVPADTAQYTSGETVTVLDNTGNLVKTGYTFGGWNTATDGAGTNYAAGNQITITEDITLYAGWALNAPTINGDTKTTYGTPKTLTAELESGFTPSSVSYQWYLNGTVIEGATGKTYQTLENLPARESPYVYTVTITVSDETSDKSGGHEFEVEPLTATLQWTDASFIYNGSNQAPTASVSNLRDSDSCTVTVTGAQTNVGKYIATASGLTGDAAGNYTLPANPTQAFSISAKPVTKPTEDTTSFVYTGTEHTYNPAGFDKAVMNIAGNKMTAAGSQDVTVSLKDSNNYHWADDKTESLTFTFTITPRTLSTGTEITLQTNNLKYSGTEQTVMITSVTNLSNTLAAGTDYTVTSDDKGTNIGEYTLTITGTGNYTETASASWSIIAGTDTITFDKNGGSGGSDSVVATYGEAMPAATMPTRDGYTFAGYSDAATNGVKYYNADGSSAKNWDKTENTTLYAYWIQTSVTPKQPTMGEQEVITGGNGGDVTIDTGSNDVEVSTGTETGTVEIKAKSDGANVKFVITNATVSGDTSVKTVRTTSHSTVNAKYDSSPAGKAKNAPPELTSVEQQVDLGVSTTNVTLPTIDATIKPEITTTVESKGASPLAMISAVDTNTGDKKIKKVTVTFTLTGFTVPSGKQIVGYHVSDVVKKIEVIKNGDKYTMSDNGFSSYVIALEDTPAPYTPSSGGGGSGSSHKSTTKETETPSTTVISTTETQTVPQDTGIVTLTTTDVVTAVQVPLAILADHPDAQVTVTETNTVNVSLPSNVPAADVAMIIEVSVVDASGSKISVNSPGFFDISYSVPSGKQMIVGHQKANGSWENCSVVSSGGNSWRISYSGLSPFAVVIINAGEENPFLESSPIDPISPVTPQPAATPAPVLGLLAGLGAAAVFFRARKQ